jgi:hypothetical protein
VEPENVTPLRENQAPLNPAPPPSPATGLHGIAITAMAVFAMVGIALVLALITVNWNDASRKVIITIVVLISIGFIASASLAVFAAARDTYPHRKQRPDGD